MFEIVSIFENELQHEINTSYYMYICFSLVDYNRCILFCNVTPYRVALCTNMYMYCVKLLQYLENIYYLFMIERDHSNRIQFAKSVCSFVYI